MAQIFIQAKVIAGTNVELAIGHAIELSKRIGTPVEVNFNGCLLMMEYWETVAEKVKEYEDWLASQTKQ